jgi:hypothetical protein
VRVRRSKRGKCWQGKHEVPDAVGAKHSHPAYVGDDLTGGSPEGR